MNDQEIWKPIPSFPRYEASSQGRIRNSETGTILRPTISNPAYYVVGIYGENRSRPIVRRVHVLVSEAFLGPRPKGMVTRHGPGGCLDNSVANLSYGTQSQNLLDCHRDGTAPVGTRNPQAKLSEADIPVIRQRLQREQGAVIARDYGCSTSLIYLIKHNKIWTHV